MSDTIKNILAIVFAIIVSALLAIAAYNTFFKDSGTTEKTEIIENNQNNQIDTEQENEDTFDNDASFTLDSNEVSNTHISSIEYNGKTYSFGIENDSSLPGIIINPKVENSNSKYIIFCSATNGYIVTNEELDKINPYSDNFDETQYIYCRDTSLNGYNAEYIDDSNFGIMWKGDSDNIDGTANINVKFFNYDDFTFEAVFNLTLTINEHGMYAISNIDNCNYIDNNDTVISDEALNILNNNMDYYSVFKPKAVICEKINEIYYNSMTKPNGYDKVVKGKVDRSIYPCYATSFIFEDMPGVVVTVYSDDYGNYIGYAEFSLGESLSILENELNIEY